jgi:predicted ATPase
MIEKAVFRNYRALRDVDVTFAPLTAFVGPNASGKSSLLRALDINTSLDARDVWRHDAKSKFHIQVTAEGGGAIRRTQFGSGGPSPFSVQPLRLDLSKMRISPPVVASERVSQDGGNAANVFASLSKSDREELTKLFRDLVPVFGDVDVRPGTTPGHHGFVFEDRWAKRVAFGADEVSDGTLLVLAYLVVSLQHPPPDVVAIEEPEHGLHPYLLAQLVSLFRKMTTGIGDRPPIQVLLATHSADLLNYLRPEEVRFMNRNSADGSVSVTAPPTTSAGWEDAFREYRELMGEAWLSGGLGGVPGT